MYGLLYESGYDTDIIWYNTLDEAFQEYMSFMPSKKHSIVVKLPIEVVMKDYIIGNIEAVQVVS